MGVSLGKLTGKFIVPDSLSHTALMALGRLHLQGVSIITSSGSLTSITISLDPALLTNFLSSSGDETPGFLSFNNVAMDGIFLKLLTGVKVVHTCTIARKDTMSSRMIFI